MLKYILLLASVFALTIALPIQAQTETSTNTGKFRMEVANTLGTLLPSKATLQPISGEGKMITVNAPKGEGESNIPAGKYKVLISVYDWDLPVVVAVRDIEILPNKQEYLIEHVPEASSQKRRLIDFDQDGDLVLDRIEEECGTDSTNAASYPGAVPLPFEDVVLSDQAGWYKGDLHVRSQYGGGQESIAELIKRAEKAGLDFIAITDRETMEAFRDPAVRNSKKVLVIPAMEWGNEQTGIALIYGPRTMPELTENRIDAQGVVYRVQAQGGAFAIAHPCFPTAPWQRGLSYVNAIEVWCRESWTNIPPLALENLAEELKLRDKKGKLVFSIAVAAATPRLSANGQAEMFWDLEMARGLRAAPIGGSLSSSPKVPLGAPVTYVYAEKKSITGILDGLRRGRTYLSKNTNGPQILFQADVLANGTIDVSISGAIPVGVVTDFHINILRAKGKKAELLENGHPAVTKVIDSDNFWMVCPRTPSARSVYRVRVTDTATKEKAMFTDREVLALTGPIYAEEMIFVREGTDPLDMWIRIQNRTLPPLFVDPSFRGPNGLPLVHIDKTAPPPYEGEFQPPPDAQIRTIQPQWRY